MTRPALFRPYLEEQLTLLYQDYGAHIAVEPSQHEIPYPYVIDGSALTLDRSMSAGLTRHFPTTELSQIGDETADGIYHPAEFSPCRILTPAVWISPARLRHYTGTPAEHFQPFVLFTNYTRYVDEFVRWGCSQILTRRALISPSPAPVGSGSPPKPKRLSRLSPIWHGRSTRCQPGT